MPLVQTFVSHSYFTDDVLIRCLEQSLGSKGIAVYDHRELSKRLRVRYTGGSDWDDLVVAYRRGGRPAPTQEISDPNLHEFILEEIAKQDIVIILWSEHYEYKFWTQRELKAALSIGVPVLAISLDGHPLDPELQKGIRSGRIPLFEFGGKFSPDDVCAAIFGMGTAPAPKQPERAHDEGLNSFFLRVEHPSLGMYEIAESYFTWADVERLEIKKPPEKCLMMDIAGGITQEYVAEFCNYISLLSPYYRYRLPTESEWEFAARAGSTEVRNWIPGTAIDRDGVSVIRNAWGMSFVPNAAEWTSTSSEWKEYLGWVQPLEISGKQFGPNRASVVKRVNDGPGIEGGAGYPRLVHKGGDEARLGFRIVRERRKDINLDQVLPARHRHLARELLSETDPESLEALIRKAVERGSITRYFRGYLEHRSIETEDTPDMARSLLTQILMVEYVPPLTLPPYLHGFFRQSLSAVFASDDPKAAFLDLSDQLSGLNLLGREFAEVLRYEFGMVRDFETFWETCLMRLPENERALVSRFSGY